MSSGSASSSSPPPSPLDASLISKLSSQLSSCDVLFLATGAGMGAPSGLGTFRGKNAGVWPPLLQYPHLGFQDMSNPSWFQKSIDASLPADKHAGFGYAFWQYRYQAYMASEPHQGYQILKKWADEKQKKLEASFENPPTSFCFTSNIDAAWRRLGWKEESLYEIHGSIDFMQCTRGEFCTGHIWPSRSSEWNMKIDPEKNIAVSAFPVCEGCGKPSRPNVLMFDDDGFVDSRTEKQERAFEHWLARTARLKLKTMVIEIGAGVALPSVRQMSARVVRALNSGKSADSYRCSFLRINLEHPEIEFQTSNTPSEHLSSSQADVIQLLQAIDAKLQTQTQQE